MISLRYDETAFQSNTIVRFIDSVLRGMAQILFCSNPISGLFFIIGAFAFSTQAGVLCLIGLITATAVAEWKKYDPHFIHSGLYGYNGALVGIFWLYFGKMTLLLFILLVLGSAASVIVQHYLLYKMTENRFSLPSLSLSSLFIVWGSLLFAYAADIVPYPLPIEPLRVTLTDFLSYSDYEMTQQFLLKNAGGLILFMIGIFINSRISFLCAIASFVCVIVILTSLGRNDSIYWNNFFYNIIPLSIAFCGIFFCPRRNACLSLHRSRQNGCRGRNSRNS